MATITGAAGGGNWSAGGSWVGGVAPTASDDVLLTATSGNITIDAGAACNSLNCTGYTGTLTHTAAVTLTIGSSTAGLTSVALKLVSGMTYTLGNTGTSAINFISTSATQQSVDFGSKSCGPITFNGSGGSWQFVSAVSIVQSSSGIITLTAGSLDMNGQTITAGGVNSTNSNTRSLTLGAAAISVGCNGGNLWNLTTTTGLTFSAGTSTITVGANSDNVNFAGGGLSYNNVIFTNGARCGITGVNTFANLSITANLSFHPTIINLQANQIVSGLFTFTGISGASQYRPMLWTSTLDTQFTLTAASVSLSYCNFQNIIGAGAATWSGTSVGDGQNNTGIAFATPVTKYWVATSGGNWNAPTSWSTSSGGSSGADMPLPQDNVIFDANSISSTGKTITAQDLWLGNNLDFSAVTNTPALNLSLGNYSFGPFGNLTLGTMTFSGSGGLAVYGRGVQTFKNNGVTISASITIQGAGSGSYTLQDDLVCTNTFTQNNGTFNANNHNVTIKSLTSSNSNVRALQMGSGTWVLSGTGTIWNTSSNTNLTISGQTSTVAPNDTSASTKTFSFGTGDHLATVTTPVNSSGAYIFNTGGTYKIDTLNFATGTTHTFQASRTLQFTNAPGLAGSSGNVITINSGTSGTAASFSYLGGGIINGTFLNIKDNTPSPANTWFAGHNSTAVSNTGNWVFGTGNVATPFAATLSHSGAFSRKLLEPLTAGVSFVGAFATFNISAILNAALSFTGNAKHSITRSLTSATLSYSGNFKKQMNRSVSASISYVGKFAKIPGKSLNGQLSYAGAWLPLPTKKLTATLSYTGSVSRRVAHQLVAATLWLGNYTFGSGTFGNSNDEFGIPAIDSLLKQTNIPATANVTYIGSMIRGIRHRISATLSYTGAFTRAVTRTLPAATLSYTGKFAKQSIRILPPASMSFAAAFILQANKVLPASISPQGVITRNFYRSFSGAVSYVGRFTKIAGKTFLGGISYSGSIVKKTFKLLTGRLKFRSVTWLRLKTVVKIRARSIFVDQQDTSNADDVELE
jgi:hypothetical protein